VKQQELIRELREAGGVLLRHGARHDIYVNPATGQK
jgi:mRNA interferase HicA